ncbi:hypothetical protein CMQ_1727 [Grosmannia clavigera kw1407]|uniref:F-box domain containing protein n=1 Tax=Grosmannia clavigera (strain kw1407 / UAMH 11150) TaxID=655863 RepID=F0XCN6_GROCL|nr:uncharacterized protein CMQ_1727 [Grosmannia clavigera kw1407]EFX04799.1 hypothetical protein CMQ_1727 [Grosmannia clavigera kw1407]
MASTTQTFYCLWQDERIRETLFELLDKNDISAVRSANSACCNLVTRRLFLRTHLTFTANTFTKPSRVQALSRIGHHVEHLTFYLPHSDATFLPPLLHPLTGREISFLYTPHTSMASVLTRPKYGNPGLGDVLTQQYPPLFHAATNVPSFLNAMKHLPNMRHLTIRCPGQDPKERYRRDIVDYALISLRISLERAPLLKLSKLSLSGVHPAAFNYLRHVPGFGAMPSAARRWRQIRKLYVSVDAWDFYGPSPGLDQLKIIDDYIRHMAPQLEKFSFTWLGDDGSAETGGRKGPCPIALSGDALLAARREGPKKLFNEVTSPMSPLPPAPHREPMHFPRLRCLTLRNTTMRTPQLFDLVERHKCSIREFNCENVSLVDGGSWEEAFAPLLSQVNSRGSNIWQHNGHNGSSHIEIDGSSGSGRRNASPAQSNFRESLHLINESSSGPPSSASSTVTYGPCAVASPDDKQIPSPSAAVDAVSRDLLEMSTADLQSYLSIGSGQSFVVEQPRPKVSVPDADEYPIWMTPPPTIEEEDEEYEDELLKEEEGVREDEEKEEKEVPTSDIAAPHEAGLTFTTQLKRKHERRRHRRHQEGNSSEAGTEGRRSRSKSHGRQHHHSHSDSKGTTTDREAKSKRSRSQSRKRERSRKDAFVSRSTTTTTPPLPRAMPIHPFAHRMPPPQPRPKRVGQLDHSCNSDDDVFGPQAPGPPAAAHTLSVASAQVAPLNISAPAVAADPEPVLLRPAVYDPFTAASPGAASSFYSIMSADSEAQRRQNQLMMAEDADARSSALKKAKEAVLLKLSREFNRRIGRETAQMAAAAMSASVRSDLAAAPMASSTSSSLLSSLRWRERLFGDSLAISSQHHSMESNSAVVPLIFSRA